MNRSSEIDEITRSGVYKIHGVGATERRIHGFLFSFKAHIVFMMFSFLCFVFYGGQQDSKAEVLVTRSG
jgi:hypothetical protein